VVEGTAQQAAAELEMRILLRIVAVVVALAVVLMALMIVQFTVVGSSMTFGRSGALGILTIAAWLAVLTCGPVAAVQLWRLRRVGLSLATMLCAIGVAYFLVGLFFLRTAEAPLTPILGSILVNGVLLGLLLSPAARRACVE
jgi:hypothetical protein